MNTFHPADAARIARIFSGADLAPEITFEPRVVADTRTVTGAPMGEHRPSLQQVRAPNRLIVALEFHEKLVGGPLPQPAFGRPRQNETVGPFVGAVAVRGVAVTISCVERIVVGPGQGPVVASFGQADNGNYPTHQGEGESFAPRPTSFGRARWERETFSRLHFGFYYAALQGQSGNPAESRRAEGPEPNAQRRKTSRGTVRIRGGNGGGMTFAAPKKLVRLMNQSCEIGDLLWEVAFVQGPPQSAKGRPVRSASQARP